MPSRSAILHRIQTALRAPAHRPEPPSEGALFAPLPPSHLLTRLESELLALKAEFHQAANWGEAQDWVREIANRHELRRAVCAPHADAVQAGRPLGARILSGDGDCGRALGDADLGITICDALVARTGTAVLTTQSGFGRALSVLPSTHLIVARRAQILPDLTDAYRLLHVRHGKSWPSMITFITGPSRTADIEKILVLGAHGPRKLFVLLLDFED